MTSEEAGRPGKVVYITGTTKKRERWTTTANLLDWFTEGFDCGEVLTTRATAAHLFVVVC